MTKRTEGLGYEKNNRSAASVLMINPNVEEVVLPSFTCVGKLVPVSAVSVALADPGLQDDRCVALPDHLEEIVMGSHPSLGEAGRRLLRELFYRHKHVFPAPGEPVTGRTTSVQHEILTSDARLVRCGPRRLATAGLRTEQTCVQEMLLGGQIEPSDSLWASPVVLVTKDAYPLLRIDDSLRLLGNQQWFSTMDLASGYLQVAMSPEAKRKVALITNEGLFQFRVMPFGLCNAPATFNRVLCGMRWSRCLVYLDDVISFRRSIPEALARLEEVLGRLSDFGLQLKTKKCTFMQTEVIFLGHIVGRTGLACDPSKLSVVRNWHAPDKVKAVRQFVGFVGYYPRFVKDFAELALKACLISAPILGFPSEDERFLMDTDASLFAVGGVLNQIQDGREVVIAYASRSLRLSQRRYCTTRREMLVSSGGGGGLSLPFAGTCCWASFRLLLNIVRGLNADGMFRQCGQCRRPDCPVSSLD